MPEKLFREGWTKRSNRKWHFYNEGATESICGWGNRDGLYLAIAGNLVVPDDKCRHCLRIYGDTHPAEVRGPLFEIVSLFRMGRERDNEILGLFRAKSIEGAQFPSKQMGYPGVVLAERIGLSFDDPAPSTPHHGNQQNEEHQERRTRHYPNPAYQYPT